MRLENKGFDSKNLDIHRDGMGKFPSLYFNVNFFLDLGIVGYCCELKGI